MFFRSRLLNVFMISLILTILVCESLAQEPIIEESNGENISPEKNNNQIIILLVSLGIGLCGGLLIDFFRRSCPNCCKEWGLKRTGEQKKLKGGLSPTWLVQYKCKKCGYVLWKKISSVG